MLKIKGITGNHLSLADWLRQNLVLLIILAVASILRLWNGFNLPLFYDEYSALFRTQVPNMGALLRESIAIGDNHPAATELFLYFYSKLAGFNPFLIKLPFIAAGIFSVLLIYSLGKTWFSKVSGLWAATLMATFQYFVANSQMARPYALGLMFCLLTAWFFTRLKRTETKGAKFTIAMILSAAIALYTHYFAALWVAIFFASAFIIFPEKKLRARILWSVLSLIVLFVPHLQISLEQISHGGIGSWIGNYSLSYPVVFMAIVLHQSCWLALLIITLFIVSIRLKQNKDRYIIILFFSLPFLLSLLIGSLYSLLVSNLMHERVLYFTFPFLLLSLSGFLRPLEGIRQTALIVISLTGITLSLIFERQHYAIGYTSEYMLADKCRKNWTDNYSSDSVLQMEYADGIRKKLLAINPVQGLVILDASSSLSQLNRLLAQKKQPYLYFGATEQFSIELLSLILQYYPTIKEHEVTVGGETYLLSRNSGSMDIATKILHRIYPEKEKTGLELESFYKEKYNYLEVIIFGNIPGLNAPIVQIVSDLKVLAERRVLFVSDSAQLGFAGFRLMDVPLTKNAQLQFSNIDYTLVDSIQVNTLEGNRLIYAHVKKVKPVDEFWSRGQNSAYIINGYSRSLE